MTTPRPFVIDVEQSTLDRIDRKLADSRIGYAPQDDRDWRYGTDASCLRAFVDHWRKDYDWRAQEALLNRWPQALAEVDGVLLHFYHIPARGGGGGRLPILLMHGWPGSIVEFQAVIPLLLDAGYPLVVPSIPGFGWSGKPPRPLGEKAMAALMRRLMVDVLGYPRFHVQGGDFGSLVATQLGIWHADAVAALHLNFYLPDGPGTSADPELQAYWQQLASLTYPESGYLHQQGTKPQTLALALHDNPLGWAAWTLEKFHGWSDWRSMGANGFQTDQLITNMMTYLVTDSVISSIWMYHGSSHEQGKEGRVEAPTAIARFPGEFYPLADRSLAARRYNIVRWTEMTAGGHFAAMEAPEAFASDLIAFLDGQDC